MSLFIKVDIAFERCAGVSRCGRCLHVCPVNIFTQDESAGSAKADLPLLVDEAFDECTLCDLCVQSCRPDAIRIRKLYEEAGSVSAKAAAE